MNAGRDAPWPRAWRSTRRAVVGAGISAASALAARPTWAKGVLDAPARTSGLDRAPQDDPLPSWNDGPNKRAILDFVAAVTEEGGEWFVPAHDRIATFDNDGTLWVEQPGYAQGFFALDSIAAPGHPSGKNRSHSRRFWPETSRRWPPSPSTTSPPFWLPPTQG